MPSRKKKVYKFLAVWDMLGLESIFDIDAGMQLIEDHEKQQVWRTLQGQMIDKRKPNPIPLQMLVMRARANSQRSYEIYTFTSEFTMNEVRKIFAECPQPLVEWIRSNGTKVYSDYVKRDQKFII